MLRPASQADFLTYTKTLANTAIDVWNFGMSPVGLVFVLVRFFILFDALRLGDARHAIDAARSTLKDISIMPHKIPSVAAIERVTAQQISIHMTEAVDGPLPILLQQPKGMVSTADFPVRDLGEILEYSAKLIRKL